MEDKLTYNSEGWVQSQPESTTGNFNKWECKLFEKKKNKMNSSHALKEEEWRIPPWMTLPTWPGSLPGWEVIP